MFKEEVYNHPSTFSPAGSSTLTEPSLRDRITATIIREEAAESLLPGIRGESELVALVRVFNRFRVYWWLLHLNRVGADPETYWQAQLGDEIRAATRGEKSASQRKKFPRRFSGLFSASVKYELCDLDLDPL